MNIPDAGVKTSIILVSQHCANVYDLLLAGILKQPARRCNRHSAH